MNVEKWIDELQIAVADLARKIRDTAAAAFSPVITTPADGQAIVYDATNKVWVNGDMPGSAEEWTVLACNSSGFPVNDDVLYQSGAGESLADFSEFAIVLIRHNSNVANGRAFTVYVDPVMFRTLAAKEVSTATPFSAYSSFCQYCLFEVQRIGVKFNYTDNTIKQDDYASDTGTVSIRVIAILGKKAPVAKVTETRSTKRRKTK